MCCFVLSGLLSFVPPKILGIGDFQPIFKTQITRGQQTEDTKFGHVKMFMWSLHPLPLLKGHLYFSEKGHFSWSRSPF